MNLASQNPHRIYLSSSIINLSSILNFGNGTKMRLLLFKTFHRTANPRQSRSSSRNRSLYFHRTIDQLKGSAFRATLTRINRWLRTAKTWPILIDLRREEHSNCANKCHMFNHPRGKARYLRTCRSSHLLPSIVRSVLRHHTAARPHYSITRRSMFRHSVLTI